MSILRKVTAAASAIAILSSALGTSFVSAANDGFLPFAKALANNTTKIIQLQSSDDAYRTSDNITRAEVAGIALSLKNVELPADYTCKGTFSDTSATKPSSWACRAAELAADNGIAAKNATFRPSDNITRAEALAMILKSTGVAIATGTTTSSFQDTFSADWQRDVANAALAAGIASANTYFNPNNNITRGEFFAFAYNAGKKSWVVTTDKADYEQDLGLGDIIGGTTTSTGTTTPTSTGTTSTGVTTPTAAGTLNIALNPTSPANGTQVPMNGTVRFAVVDFTAGGSDISLNSVSINKAGLASINPADRVWFEKNGVRVSGKTSFTSDNNAVISFAPAYVVKAGTTESLDLYVQLADTVSGNDYQFVSGTVSSSAVSVTGSFTSSILRTAAYTVDSAVISKIGSGLSYNASNDPIELSKFTVQNQKPAWVTDTRDLKFQSITLVQNGNANLTNLSNITVERNGIVVSTGTPIINGRDLTVSVNDTILDWVTATYTLKAVINNVDQQSGDSYQFYLKNTSDANLVEVNTSFRASITNSNLDSTNANTYIIQGWDVKFDRDASVALSANVAPGTDNVVLMQGTITAKSAITLEDINAIGYSVNGASNTWAIPVLNTVYLQIGSSTFSWTPANGAASFLGTATINGTVPVKMYTKLRNDATGTVKFNDLNLAAFTTKQYVSNQNNIQSAIGSIPGVTVTINSSSLNLTRTDGLGDTSIPSGVNGQLVYGAKFSSTQGNPIALSNLSITATGGAAAGTTLTLYVNWVAKDSKTIQNGNTITFNNFNATVSTTSSTDIQIKADFLNSATGTFQISSIAYQAIDALTSNSVTQSSIAGANFTIATAIGTLAASDSSPKAQLLLAGAKDQKLVAFKVTSTNDTIKLRDVTLTGSNLDKVSNIRLIDANWNVLGTASSTLVFNNLDNASGSSIATWASPYYFVIADINTNTDLPSLTANINVAGSDITSSNGTVIPMVWSNVSSASHAVAQNIAIFAKQTNSNKTLNNQALVFTVTASTSVGNNSGNNTAVLSWITVSSTIFGTTWTGIVKIYKNTVSAANLAGSFTPITNGSSTEVIPLTANNTVDSNGTPVTYILTVEGIGVWWVANITPGWTINVNDIQIGAISASNYTNLGTFPLTETWTN